MAGTIPSEPRLIHRAWLDAPETRAVFAAIEAGGYEARAVGGAVRNALLGRQVKDVDIATPALPQEVLRLAASAGLKAVPTGVEHGTVTVISGGAPFEVTTLRKDVETYGRHAAVAYTDDWAADAARRDFTINALYCGPDGRIYDPLAGYGDLVARRVRFIGEARTRIREDYLRILRFFRFTAEYADGPPDPEGLSAAVAERAGLKLLSGERIRQELVRLLAAPRALAAVEAMYDYGLITELLGLAPRPRLLRRLALIEDGRGLVPSPILRLAALVVEVMEDAERLNARLKLSNAERASLLASAVGDSGALREPPLDTAAGKAFIYRHGARAYRDLVLMAWTRALTAATDDPQWSAKLDLADTWRPPKFALTGSDVMALGIAEGPRVGELLRRTEEWWIAAGFPDDRELLLAQLQAAARTP
ncbi:MAG TPA: CCA tRNA nucleotidyltransferase [Hyphomicrobiaceae bacterium]|nr:CCA tRNA nucleotidyltransferase [Hyphomicrobiaceae bacterium]